MKTRLVLLTITVLLIGSIWAIVNYESTLYKRTISNQKLQREQLLNEIKERYAKIVITNKDSDLYVKEGAIFLHKGEVSKDTILSLDKVDNITISDRYFKIANMPYYIYYDSLEPLKERSETNKDYKNYIVFNENIVTKIPFKMYDETDREVFSLQEEMSFPIIIKDDSKYYIEYNDNLLYVLKDDVKEIRVVENTTEPYANGIAALNYHFFYDDSLGEKCNQIICLKTSKFEEQLKYLNDNNYYATKMKDVELFIDGKIRLPEKSVSITIDDGGMGVADKAVPLLEKYKMNATLFLVTSWWDKKNYESPYLEIHSHGHNLHNKGGCSGKDGGDIKCLEKTKLLDDLKASRDALDGTTVFCYPFYEYNDYAISTLKEAGFHMAFASGTYKIKKGANKFVLPRYVIFSYTTFDEFTKMIR